LGRSRGWTFLTHVTLSLLITSVLAYVSWHALEKRALRSNQKQVLGMKQVAVVVC